MPKKHKKSRPQRLDPECRPNSRPIHHLQLLRKEQVEQHERSQELDTVTMIETYKVFPELINSRRERKRLFNDALKAFGRKPRRPCDESDWLELAARFALGHKHKDKHASKLAAIMIPLLLAKMPWQEVEKRLNAVSNKDLILLTSTVLRRKGKSKVMILQERRDFQNLARVVGFDKAVEVMLNRSKVKAREHVADTTAQVKAATATANVGNESQTAVQEPANQNNETAADPHDAGPPEGGKKRIKHKPVNRNTDLIVNTAASEELSSILDMEEGGEGLVRIRRMPTEPSGHIPIKLVHFRSIS